MPQRIETQPPLLVRRRIAEHAGDPAVGDFMEYDRNDQRDDDCCSLQQKFIHGSHLGATWLHRNGAPIRFSVQVPR